MNHQRGCFLPEDNRARKKVSAPINLLFPRICHQSSTWVQGQAYDYRLAPHP